MRPTAPLLVIYRKFRRHSPFMLVGHSARLALQAAKTILRFQELESDGLVRIRCEAEEESYFSVYGEPEGYTDGNGRRVSTEDTRRELADVLDRLGCWWTVSEWWDGEEWQEADSCGMHTGYQDPASPFENCYIVDEMRAAIDALESHQADALAEEKAAHEAACRDIQTVTA